MKVQNRDTNVDILRIIACLAVVGLHTLGIGISRTCDFLYYQCGFAVPIFFMASGYMLLARNNTVAYSIRKVSRLIIFTLLWYCVLLPFEIEGGYSLLSIVKGYIFVFLQGGLLGHFWYFAALGFLYALLPFLGKIVHSRSNINFLWFCTASVCVTIQVVSYMKGYPIQKNFPQALRVWTWVQYFLLGGVVSYNIEIVHKVSSKSIAKMILVILFVIIPVVEMNFGIKVLNVKYAEYFYDSFLNIIWNFLIFSVCISLNNESAKCCISKLALLTLGVYAIHFILLTVIHHMWTISSSIQAIVLFALTSLISFTVTWMLYHSPISWFVKL